MIDIFAAIGILLILEGAAFAVYPEHMRRIMLYFTRWSETALKYLGGGMVVVGVLALWWAWV